MRGMTNPKVVVALTYNNRKMFRKWFNVAEIGDVVIGVLEKSSKSSDLTIYISMPRASDGE